MTDPIAARGDVWFAAIEGDKRRPVLVLSRDPMGELLHSVICAPITSTVRGLSTEVPLGAEAGLANDSVANFDSTMLVARASLIRRIGRATDITMRAGCAALTKAAGC